MSKVLVGLTGSIACFKVASLISELVKGGHEVRTIATPSALKFIGKSTLEGLTGSAVHTDLFADGGNMEHIDLGRWADLMLIAPCTANTMAKLKIGLADELLSTTALAFEKDKPVFIAPAMNKEMWSNPTTEESYEVLKARGFQFIDPEVGPLACGETGDGRLAEVETIMAALFANPNKKILITGGGTREPIDGVRFIGNSSTGKTSAALAESLRLMGYDVDLLMAQSSFTDFKSLEKLLKETLQNQEYDAVVHAAAVSDYSVSKVQTPQYVGPANRGLKLRSGKQMNIELKPNPKLLNSLRSWSLNQDIQILGFKLTQTEVEGEREAAIEKLFEESSADFVIHNDLTEIGFGSHPFRITNANKVYAEVDGAGALAEEISKILEGGHNDVMS